MKLTSKNKNTSHVKEYYSKTAENYTNESIVFFFDETPIWLPCGEIILEYKEFTDVFMLEKPMFVSSVYFNCAPRYYYINKYC